jgi:hypothetical protein
MATLIEIFDGIMDRAAEEYRDTNLATAESVAQYAEGALDTFIGDEEAEEIRSVALWLIDELETGNGEWDRIWREARARLRKG